MTTTNPNETIKAPSGYWVLSQVYAENNGETKFLGLFSTEKKLRSAIHATFLYATDAKSALQYEKADTSLISIESVGRGGSVVAYYDNSHYYFLQAVFMKTDVLCDH